MTTRKIHAYVHAHVPTVTVEETSGINGIERSTHQRQRRSYASKREVIGGNVESTANITRTIRDDDERTGKEAVRSNDIR